MWLLDANLDIRICELLSEFGIESHTAESCGWKHLLNGQLVSAAMAEGFTCLLTRDQLFAESASRALKQYPQFAVVFDSTQTTEKVSVPVTISHSVGKRTDRAHAG